MEIYRRPDTQQCETAGGVYGYFTGATETRSGLFIASNLCTAAAIINAIRNGGIFKLAYGKPLVCRRLCCNVAFSVRLGAF